MYKRLTFFNHNLKIKNTFRLDRYIGYTYDRLILTYSIKKLFSE